MLRVWGEWNSLNSHFFPISKKVCALPYIHHLNPVNCFIFVKFWVVNLQQHLSLILTIMLSCKVWNILGIIISKKLKRKKNLAHYKLLSKKNCSSWANTFFWCTCVRGTHCWHKDYQFLSDCIWFNYLQFMNFTLMVLTFMGTNFHSFFFLEKKCISQVFIFAVCPFKDFFTGINFHGLLILCTFLNVAQISKIKEKKKRKSF